MYTYGTLNFPMTTRFVGIKEFRQNMATISEQAHKCKQRLIIMRKNKAIFELRPLSHKASVMESLLADLAEADADIKAGRVYTAEQVKKMLRVGRV